MGIEVLDVSVNETIIWHRNSKIYKIVQTWSNATCEKRIYGWVQKNYGERKNIIGKSLPGSRGGDVVKISWRSIRNAKLNSRCLPGANQNLWIPIPGKTRISKRSNPHGMSIEF